jgi:DNA-binding IclR family transcriptional regulator
MVSTADQPGGRSVTSKVLALFSAFSVTKPELSLNELAERAEIPLSTAYRLVTELVAWGALERVDGGGYRIGVRLWEIGSLAPRTAGVREIARPFMQDLYVATRENVQLAVLGGQEALYIERVTGRHAVGTKVRKGGRLPLHATGAGKVLLAYAPKQLLSNLVAAGLRRYTPHTIVAPGHLTRELAEIRRTGVGYAREELTLGSVSVASPIFNGDGTVAAALSIVVRSTGADLARLAPAVRTAALCASRRMGKPTTAGQMDMVGARPAS